MIADRYVLGPHIGVGSTATVYRARDVESACPVAVKLFLDGSDARAADRQRRELRAMAHLHHPALVRLRGGGVDHGRLYTVADLVEGHTLAERLSRSPLELPEVYRIGAHLAFGLAHLHLRGVIHRDVKPSNVLLYDRSGAAGLTDFGIARVLGYTALTETGCILGTGAYLSPEQARGEPVGPPTDVYALGLLLLEALTGRREYPGTPIESAVARLHRRPRIPDGLPPELRCALDAATITRPEDRPDASEIATALTAALRRT